MYKYTYKYTERKAEEKQEEKRLCPVAIDVRVSKNAKDGLPKMPRQCVRGSDRGNLPFFAGNRCMANFSNLYKFYI